MRDLVTEEGRPSVFQPLCNVTWRIVRDWDGSHGGRTETLVRCRFDFSCSQHETNTQTTMDDGSSHDGDTMRTTHMVRRPTRSFLRRHLTLISLDLVCNATRWRRWTRRTVGNYSHFNPAFAFRSSGIVYSSLRLLSFFSVGSPVALSHSRRS